MTTVIPDDIPTSVTRLVYAAPATGPAAVLRNLSQNDAAAILAHFWPAIREHFAQVVTDNPDFGDLDPIAWVTDLIRSN